MFVLSDLSCVYMCQWVEEVCQTQNLIRMLKQTAVLTAKLLNDRFWQHNMLSLQQIPHEAQPVYACTTKSPNLHSKQTCCNFSLSL